MTAHFPQAAHISQESAESASRFPLRHVTIRVPWHDSGWNGTVCAAPHLNGACAKLKRIAEAKDGEQERLMAGTSLKDLPPEQLPACIDERATFMAPFDLMRDKVHPLGDLEPFRHLLPTRLRYPAYSALVVPFWWMLRDNARELAELYDLDVDLSREPPELGDSMSWLNEFRNQEQVLNAFAAHLRPQESLCLFYAKHVPFVEGTNRVLIGAGRLLEIGSLTEYRRRNDQGNRGLLWERPVRHSIRPDGRDGFLMPYHAILEMAAENPNLDLARYTAYAPAEFWQEFSYGSELLPHDGAIAALLAMDGALGRIEEELGIATDWQRQWIHDELVRLWKVRGPYPGLGAVLKAFGLSRGLFIAHALQQRVGDGQDPWPLLEQAFADPAAVLTSELTGDMKALAPIWRHLPDERKQFLRLLSRFELNVGQAERLYDESARRVRGWFLTDREVIENPYRLYETTRHDPQGVPLFAIDRGCFPHDVIRLQHPREEPSRLESAVDRRRIRALVIAALEDAADAGHTVQEAGELVQAVRDRGVQPPCPVTADMLRAHFGQDDPEVVAFETEEGLVLQLRRYQQNGDIIRRSVGRRIRGKRHAVDANWRKLLDERIGPVDSEEDELARHEKAHALAELAESRFSVLVGSAGTGKTTVLGVLCSHPAIHAEGVLLLAPTGKARVRLQELAGDAGAEAYTVAQFLAWYGRYDVSTARYCLSDSPRATEYGTVIVDEASMLTEDMLAALLDCLPTAKRVILVGDPSQLPPIGAGRPFVDIVRHIRPDDIERRFPRVARGYAELTVVGRQRGGDRPDLRLARWFSASAPAPGDDDVWALEPDHPNLRFVQWRDAEDFRDKLLDVLVQELQLSGPDDERGFNRSLGCTVDGDYDYFNWSNLKDGKPGAVAKIEAWQILSPIRSMPFGVHDINRLIHDRFRQSFVELRTWRGHRPIPRPLGDELIVYGDKVINLANHVRPYVFPDEGALQYVANGEIGIVVGQWKRQGRPQWLYVEFSSQKGYVYKFHERDFREEGVPLELAYALTVHKAQGSQFELVILVLPDGHPIMSRELIYTALTRHQNRVVVMHQGPRHELVRFAAPHLSETARRRTNLFTTCRMVEVSWSEPVAGSRLTLLQEGLVHRTSRGVAVRSKSELLIAEALESAGILYEYEKPLSLGGITRYPDFTIEDEMSGRTVYWEHLGMLDRQDYQERWKEKLAWYRSHGVLPLEEGGDGETVLVTTTETPERGIDMGQINELIQRVLLD